VLSGPRFAVKYLFDVAGTRTGAGNLAWLAEAPVAATHAPAVAALLGAGADLLGKTVTDELAISLSGTNVHYGTPRNPAAPGRIPGSSSGSASAVAGGSVDLALGTDTAGLVRVPASYCGIYGLRPTHGRIESTGVVPLTPSFDTVGLFAADGAHLADGWRALRTGATVCAMAGTPMPGTATAVRRLVLATDLLALADDDARVAVVTAAVDLARRLGLELSESPLGGREQLPEWRDAFRVMQMVEAWRVHGRWIESRHPSFGPGIAGRFALAAAADADAARRAEPVRAEVRQALGQILGDDAVLVQPAASGPAPHFEMEPGAKDDLRGRTLLTTPAGLARAPVVSLPLAAVEGLPIGLALVGRPGDDDALVALAEQSGDLA
jgi:amidase